MAGYGLGWFPSIELIAGMHASLHRAIVRCAESRDCIFGTVEEEVMTFTDSSTNTISIAPFYRSEPRTGCRR